MGITELLLIAAGLSMDAFAVSICKGLKMRKINYKHAFIIGAFFGGFQALMPLIGWALGRQFEQIIHRFDYWIAFILLTLIGAKMAFEAFKKDEEAEETFSESIQYKELFLLAIATSIDALAVGVTFAFMKVPILSSVIIIGITTLTFSVIGVAVGNRFGAIYKSKAEFAGGVILILIGVKILIEGLI